MTSDETALLVGIAMPLTPLLVWAGSRGVRWLSWHVAAKLTGVRAGGSLRRLWMQGQLPEGQLEVQYTDNAVLYLRLEVAGLLRGLTVGPAPRRHGEALTGDPEFDGRVLVQGAPHHEMLALLDHETRRLLRDATVVGLRVTGESLTCEARSATTRARTVWRLSRLARSAARACSADQATPERLGAITLDDPLVAVRRRAMAALRGGWPEHDVTAQVCRQALDDADLVLRAHAALQLDAAAVERIEALFLEPQLGPPLFEALGVALLRHRGEAVVASRLEEALAVERGEAIVCAAAFCADHGVDPGLGCWTSLLRNGTQAQAAAAAGALGALAPVGAEDALLAGLERPGVQARAQCAMALGQLGTLKAVAPLLALADAWRTPREVRTAAREAIADIQSRLGDVDRGRLTVIEERADDGRLTVAVQGGTLSPPPGADPGR